MPPNPTSSALTERSREIEMRLFEEIGVQIKSMADAVREFGADMRDVRERVIRIEAQDQPQKLAKLEVAIDVVREEVAKVDRQSDLALAGAVREGEAALAAAVNDAASERAKIVLDNARDKLQLEKRLTRMEVIIAPITAIASALLSAAIGLTATLFAGHIH